MDLNLKRQPQPRTHIRMTFLRETKLIPVDDIVYIQADEKYAHVFHKNGSFLLPESLSQLEAEFKHRMIRIHRKTLVMRHEIAGLVRLPGNCNRILLKSTDIEFDVGRRRVCEIEELLDSAQFSTTSSKKTQPLIDCVIETVLSAAGKIGIEKSLSEELARIVSDDPKMRSVIHDYEQRVCV